MDAHVPTVVSSVREPEALKQAVKVAVELGLDANANDVTAHALGDRLEAFAQYERGKRIVDPLRGHWISAAAAR